MYRFALALSMVIAASGCTAYFNPTENLALGPHVKQEIDKLVSGLNVVEAEARTRYIAGENVLPKDISGHPFDNLPWNIGLFNERKFFIEISELSYLQCEGLKNSRQAAITRYINGRIYGSCDNANVIRWIYKK